MAIEDGDLGTVNVGDKPNSGVGELNDMGLTAEEAAQWQSMQESDGQPMAPTDDLGADADLPIDEALAKRGAAPEGDPPPEREAKQPEGEADPAAGDEPLLPPENPKQHTVSYQKYRRDLKRLADMVEELRAAPKTASDPKLQSDHEALKAAYARLEGRTSMLLDAINGAAKAPEKDAKADPAVDDPEPSIDDEPFKWMAWQKREMARLREEMRAGGQKVEAVAQARNQDQENDALMQQFGADVQAFAVKEPLIGAAYHHLKMKRYSERARVLFNKPLIVDDGKGNRAWGVTREEMQELTKRFMIEEHGLVQAAIAAGRSPAQLIWDLALERDFNPEAVRKQVAAANGGDPAKANGKAPVKQEEKKPSVAEAVKAIREGQENSLSLSDGGAAPEGGRLTLRQVAHMSDNDFAALYERLGRDGINRELLGGPAN